MEEGQDYKHLANERFVMGMSWERIAADYNLLEGGLMPVGLAVMFFSPLIAMKLRDGKRVK